MNTARDEIMKRLEKAQTGKKFPQEPEPETSYFPEPELPLELSFKKNIEAVSGSFYSFKNGEDLFLALHSLISDRNWKSVYCPNNLYRELLRGHSAVNGSEPDYNGEMEAAITGCEFLIAQTGSVIVSSASPYGRRSFTFPEVHLVIALENQLVKTLNDAYKGLTEKYGNDLPSQITLITGPSRTADIEKTLVLGAHGPREIHVFLMP